MERRRLSDVANKSIWTGHRRLNPPQVDLCFSNASGRPGYVRPVYNKGLYVQTVFHFMNFLVSTVILGLKQLCEAVIRV